MNKAENNIMKCLMKRQDALFRFKARKEAYLISREAILKDIEEAANIWKKTLDQLPGQPFDK
jgi:hypothetical protein